MERNILFVHGFASAGSSGSALQMRTHLYPMGIGVISPDLPTSPLQAMEMLKKLVEEEHPELIVSISMGAMYAEQLHGIRRILVNPSFHMARLLTFRGLGKQQEFRNKRQDGATHFKVDKNMVNEFTQVEKLSFKGIDAHEKELVYGLFGTQDRQVNCQPEFKKHYGTGHMTLFEGEHFLNGAVVSHTVMPLVEKLLQTGEH